MTVDSLIGELRRCDPQCEVTIGNLVITGVEEAAWSEEERRLAGVPLRDNIVYLKYERRKYGKAA